MVQRRWSLLTTCGGPPVNPPNWSIQHRNQKLLETTFKKHSYESFIVCFLTPPKKWTTSFPPKKIRGRQGGWKKRGRKTSRRTPLPKTGLDPLFVWYVFHSPQVPLLFLYRHPRLSTQEALLEGSGKFSGGCVVWYVSPHMIMAPKNGQPNNLSGFRPMLRHLEFWKAVSSNCLCLPMPLLQYPCARAQV